MNLDFRSLVGALETSLQATLDFISQGALDLTGLLGTLQKVLQENLDITGLVRYQSFKASCLLAKSGGHTQCGSRNMMISFVT